MLKQRHLAPIVAFLVLVAGCGDDDDDYDRPCAKELSADQSARMTEYSAANGEAMTTAIAAARAMTGQMPLVPTKSLGRELLPADFPYPNAVLASDSAQPIDLSSGLRALISHGTGLDGFQIYETSLGSRTFFLVDEIGGDGNASNTSEAVGASSHNHLRLQESTDILTSWHNWHVNPAGELQRLNLVPNDDYVETIALCGCGPGSTETAGKGIASKDASALRRPIGLFLIPTSASSVIPTRSVVPLDAGYDQRRIILDYVPKKGSKCAQERFVC